MRRLLTIVVLTALLSGCGTLREAAFPKPDFTLVSAKLTRLSLSDATLDCIVRITNTDNKPWTARDMKTGIYVNGRLVGVGVHKEVKTVPPNSSRDVSVTVTATFQDILRTVDVYRRDDVKEVPFELKGTIDLASAVGMLTVDFREDGKIPVPRAPKISFKKVRMEDIGLVRYLILFTFEVKNPNVFDMRIDNFHYECYVSDELIARGRRKRQWTLPAEGSADLELPIETRLSKVARALRLAIESGRVDYHLKGKVVFTSALGTTDFPVDKKGHIKLHEVLGDDDEKKEKKKRAEKG